MYLLGWTPQLCISIICCLFSVIVWDTIAVTLDSKVWVQLGLCCINLIKYYIFREKWRCFPTHMSKKLWIKLTKQLITAYVVLFNLNHGVLLFLVVWKWNIFHRLMCLNTWSTAGGTALVHWGNFGKWGLVGMYRPQRVHQRVKMT